MRVSKNQLQTALMAALNDPTRYMPNAVRFEFDRIVSTDGFRLHFVPIEQAGDESTEPFQIEVTDLKRLVKAMGAKDIAEVSRAGEKVAFVIPGGTFAFEPLVGDYPDYKKVTDSRPSAPTYRIAFNPVLLKQLCEAVIKGGGKQCVVLEFGPDPVRDAMYFEADGVTGCLMPMKVK